MDRPEKLQMLLRQNEGRSKRPHFVNRLTDLLGCTLQDSDFLSLEKTEKLREMIIELWHDANKQQFVNVQDAQEFIKQLNIPKEMTGFMLLSISEYIGAMNVGVTEMVSKLAELFKIESDTISFCDASGAFFLGIDFFEDFGDWKYEVAYKM